jgi:orotidine-5'-phosphate decarboxylase
MTFIEKYNKRVEKSNSLLCVGLDSDYGQLPAKFQNFKHAQFVFNTWIIEQTHQYVSAYKPNTAFYEARGDKGWQELQLTIQYLREKYPDIAIILDAKRADIGHTNQGYVTSFFDELKVDAVTLHPYLGQQALQPFLDRADKGCIILCKTSNPNSGEFQDVVAKNGQKIWQIIAKQVVTKWNSLGNCLLVIGATYPAELAAARQLAGEMTFLVPGIGTQGGDIKAILKVGLNKEKKGLIVNASRDIIFAKNPALAALKLRNQINIYRG